MFQLEFAQINCCQKKDFILDRPKGMKCYDMVLFKTKANIRINGKMETIDKDTMIIYSKNSPQYYYAYEENLVSDFLHFNLDDEIAETVFDKLIFDKPFPIKHVEVIEKLMWLITFEYYYNNQSNIKSNISHLLNVLFKKIEDEVTPSQIPVNHEKFKTFSAIRYSIIQNPNRNWSIGQLAKSCNMSESYFQIVYKQLFGTNCISDVIDARLEMAKELITGSSASVQNIAANCGYNNIEHFSRQFKKKYGITPLKYRNLNKIE